MSFDLLIDKLTRAGVVHTVHQHEPATTVEESLVRLPFPSAQYLKTLVFRAGDQWVLTALRGHDRIDYRRLAAALSVTRAAIRAASPAEVESAVGCMPGAICPIPLKDDVVALLDSDAATLGVVFTGVTRPDRTLEIEIAAIVAVASPEIVPLRRID